MRTLAPATKRPIVATVLSLAAALLVTTFGAGNAAAISGGPNGSDGDMVLGLANESEATTQVSSPTDAFGASSVDDVGLRGSSTQALGVFGAALSDVGANGVFGKSYAPTASGVYGEAGGTGNGVVGRNIDEFDFNAAVLALSNQGTALKVNGRARFSQSGIVIVPATQKSVQVHWAGSPVAPLIVLAMPLARVPGVVVLAAENPSPGTATIYLNKAPGIKMPLAWFVFYSWCCT